MSEKIRYTKKQLVSERQIYRRVAESVDKTFKEIKSKIITSEHYENVPNSDGSRSFEEELDINTAHIDCFGDNFACDSTLNNSFLVNSNPKIDNIIKNDLQTHLRQWALTYQIPLIATNNLLKILSPFHPQIVLDGRSLLKTPSSMPSKQLENGELCYIGIEQYLKRFIIEQSQIENNLIEISFNIDGLPLFHSSNVQLWPILGLIKNIPQQPFPIAIFCGNSKPSPLSIYLEDFIHELSHLLKDGFEYKQIKYFIKVHSFICDAPARAFIKCTKTHSGYSSCDKCTQSGEYVQGRVVMRNTSAPKRTDLMFNLQIDEDHHLGTSPLTELSIGLVSNFPIDYMHAVCLGVMRKMLNSWISGTLKVRLRSSYVNLLSKKLINLRSSVPVEFSRKPRSLSELARWKATEFRSFLLYFGPLVLKDILPIAVYENFLLFHFAILILCCEKHIQEFGYLLAGKLLNMFIKHCEHIYGSQFLIYNVHILCHLCDDAIKYGCLDKFSAFPFENYLKKLKNLVRSPNRPLQQIFRRLKEIDFLNANDPSLHNDFIPTLEYNTGPFPRGSNIIYRQYRKIKYKNFLFCVNSYRVSDSYCLLKNNTLLQIDNILVRIHDDVVVLYGRHFESYSSFYTYPFASETAQIFLVKELSYEYFIYDVNDIAAKCVVMPVNNSSWISFPIIHEL